MQHDARDAPTPARHQPGEHLGGEGPARTGHLGLPGSVAYTFWYVDDRPRPRDVPVADGAAVHGQVACARARGWHAWRSTGGRPGGRVRRQERARRSAIAGSIDLAGTPPRTTAASGRRSSTVHSSAGRLGGEVHLERAARGRRRIAAARVPEVLTTTRSPCVEETRAAPRRCEWTSVPSLGATSIRTASRVMPRASGGDRRLELGREVE